MKLSRLITVSTLVGLASLSVMAQSTGDALAGTSWNLSGPMGDRVVGIHGEHARASGVMTFNVDGTCSLAITATGIDPVTLTCTYTTFGDARRFDINWDDTSAQNAANALAAGLLGSQADGASVDLEIERSFGIYRPVLNRLRVNTRLAGVVNGPALNHEHRFAFEFTMAGEPAAQ